MRCLLSLLLATGLAIPLINGDMLESFAEWSLLDFDFPASSAFVSQYNPMVTVPTGFEVGWDRIFLNIPRLRAGVPATVAYLPRTTSAIMNPRLRAYPSWDWHTAGIGDLNCSRLISTYRMRIDRCERLWILDAGVMTSIDDFTPVCPPKLLVFDLRTDELVRSYVFPRQSLRPNSLLTNLVLDDTKAHSCDDIFVYITDTAGPGLVTYDAKTDRSWRSLHATMFPHPDFSMYRIGSDMFELMDGVIGLGFSQNRATLYYHPFATNRLYSLPTSALQAPQTENMQLPVTLIGQKSSQSISLTIDHRDDTILFSPLTETAIASWNPQTNYQRVVAQDPEKLQFVAEVRYAMRDGNNLWALSTRFQKYFLRTLNANEVNVRLMRVLPEHSSDPRNFQPFPHVPLSYPGFNYYNNSIFY